MATGTKRSDGGTRASAPDPDGSTPGVPVAELSYSDASQELDDIIAELEDGLVDVDLLVERLQRATDIVDELDRRLHGTRLRVEELVPRLESIGRDEDEELGEAGDGDGDSDSDSDSDGDGDGDRGTAPGLF